MVDTTPLPVRAGRVTRLSECLVGDETGTILLAARNDQGTTRLPMARMMGFTSAVLKGCDDSLLSGKQVMSPFGRSGGLWLSVLACAVDVCKAGACLIVRNAKIDMFRTSMRLAVDQWGKLEEAEDLDLQPNVRAWPCVLLLFCQSCAADKKSLRPQSPRPTDWYFWRLAATSVPARAEGTLQQEPEQVLC